MTDSQFSAVEPLLRAGLYKEAVAAVRLSSRSGALPWESYLWLGRIEESRGRAEAAERALRKALSIVPESLLPRIELSRMLEAAGRGEEARTLLREAAEREVRALRTCGAVREGLYPFLELPLFRSQFVAALRRDPSALKRAEDAARKTGAGARRASRAAATLFAELLIERGRWTRAGQALEPAFSSGAEGVDASRIEVLRRLVSSGRYPPGLERVVLARVVEAGAEDALSREWLTLFSALMCGGLYHQAFRLGETMLDKQGGFDAPGQLLWPWWRQIQRAVAEKSFIRRELVRMRRAGRKGGYERWFSYYRAVLLSDCDRNREALAEYETLKGIDPARYSWMLQSFVLVRLNLLDFEGAVSACRAVLERFPSHWWVRCRMAEALLAGGDRAACEREFETALRDPDPLVEREVRTWLGEIRLWLGEYERALACFDRALALGARTFVHGWRGAALLKLGVPAAALADLDRAVALDPKDVEARVWRSEVHRLAGRRDEALRDAEESLLAGGVSFWAFVNRALLREEGGDEKGMAEDFARIPRRVRTFLREELGVAKEAPLDRASMRKALELALERSKGVRRWEDYVQSVWMRRSP